MLAGLAPDTVVPMPRRNRVTPFGELVGSGRGLVFGNRGCLHDESGEIRRPYQVKRWIACRLDFRGRRRELAELARKRATHPAFRAAQSGFHRNAG